MGKKYIGKAMMLHSRFNEYLKGKEEAFLEKVAHKVDAYIQEDHVYCDKGNYQHLCSIFTSMALYEALVQEGVEVEEAERIVFDTIYAYMQKQRKTFERLARHNWFWLLIKKIVPIGFKKGSGVGWRYTWHNDTPKNEFVFECNRCIYLPIFLKHGYARFAPKFCHNDIIVFGSLPYTDFIRMKTLSRGDDCCDFRFVRYKKKESFKRSESV